ncbi:GTP cyclohydrolase II, partial [Coemansia thaxteri]
MPSAVLAAADPDAATAVPSTPAGEQHRLLPSAAAASMQAPAKTHFGASLDLALHILNNKQAASSPGLDLARDGSATPVNWASTDTDTGSALLKVDDMLRYSAAHDDLILNTPTRISPLSGSAISSAAASSSSTARSLPGELGDDTQAECQVRARIPYPGGHFYLHLFHTDEDDKEHLAIVFGDDIRSKTLESPRRGESDLDRKIRGASTGALRQLVQKRMATGHLQQQQQQQSSGLASETAANMIMGFEPDPADSFAALRISPVDAPLVRIHSECFTGETVSSVRCDCGAQLAEAMREIQQEGRGVIVYLRQEGRGIGLLEKLKAYNLQDMGHDTVDANLLLNHPPDARSYGSARAILSDLGIGKLRLLTNNTDKIRQLCSGRARGSRLDVVCHVPMYPRWWSDSDSLDMLSYSRHLTL